MPGYGWPSSKNLVTREDLRDSLANYSREPFGDVLEALLASRPTEEELLKWAAEKPDQWANAIKIFALLNGYTEKTESVSIHKHLHLHKLSDAELLQATQEMVSNDPSLLKDLENIHQKKLKIENKGKENPFDIDAPQKQEKTPDLSIEGSSVEGKIISSRS